MNMQLTLANVRAALQREGLLIRKIDGEYRVSIAGMEAAQAELTAYYTDDLQDAYDTALGDFWNI